MSKIVHLERLTSAEYFKGSGLACIVREMHDAPSNETIAMHDHEFSELVLVASGSLNHIYSGGTVRLRTGDFFVIHPGERHGYAELASRTVFRNTVGRSPGDYVIAMRVAKAQSILARPDASLEEAASATGFCNASHLSRTLRARRK